MSYSRLLFHASRAAVGCMFLLLAAAPSQAVEIVVEPTTPVQGDNVRIVAYGMVTLYLHGDSCDGYWFSSWNCTSIVLPTFAIEVADYWATIPPCTSGCNGECSRIDGYDVIGSCELGALPVGQYRVQATINEGAGPYTVSIPFAVDAPVPVRKVTWGSIKNSYR